MVEAEEVVEAEVDSEVAEEDLAVVDLAVVRVEVVEETGGDGETTVFSRELVVSGATDVINKLLKYIHKNCTLCLFFP